MAVRPPFLSRRLLSWYWFPIIGSIVWVATLLTLLIYWLTTGRPYYSSMSRTQSIAYISDVGADTLKPLFIAGSAITSISFFLSLFGAWWLRHRGRLAPNTSMTQKVLSWIAIVGAGFGGIGLILLAVFDTRRHLTLHRTFLAVFCLGVLLSALMTVLEYWRLNRNHRLNKSLNLSFWIKLAFFIIEFSLAVTFGVLMGQSRHNDNAIVEWVLAMLFTGYLLSFVLDLMPATRNLTGEFGKDAEAAAEAGGSEGLSTPSRSVKG